MGMVEGMHNLCEDIVTSRFERSDTIRGIKSDTAQILNDAKNAVADFGAERKKMSKELRSDLGAAVGAIQNETRGKLRDFGVARAEMSKEQAKEMEAYTRDIRKSVTEVLTDADNMMKDFTDEREKMGSELNKELGEYTAGISKDVGDLLGDFKAARRRTANDLKAIHEEWQRMVKPRVEVKGEAKVKKKVEEIEVGEEVREQELGELKAKVLEVINSCLSGISLAGIGFELDVEWRKLIRPAKELLEEGKIMKEDISYFPVKEEET